MAGVIVAKARGDRDQSTVLLEAILTALTKPTWLYQSTGIPQVRAAAGTFDAITTLNGVGGGSSVSPAKTLSDIAWNTGVGSLIT